MRRLALHVLQPAVLADRWQITLHVSVYVDLRVTGTQFSSTLGNFMPFLRGLL